MGASDLPKNLFQELAVLHVALHDVVHVLLRHVGQAAVPVPVDHALLRAGGGVGAPAWATGTKELSMYRFLLQTCEQDQRTDLVEQALEAKSQDGHP